MAAKLKKLLSICLVLLLTGLLPAAARAMPYAPLPTIRHTVTQTIVDGKYVELAKDRTKTKSSHRSLPLVPPFEALLKELRKKQEEYMDLCGNSYCEDYLDYVYVNAIGQRIKPGYLTQAFPEFLEKHGMRRIRFHDLRHPYVKPATTNNCSRWEEMRQSIIESVELRREVMSY